MVQMPQDEPATPAVGNWRNNGSEMLDDPRGDRLSAWQKPFSSFIPIPNLNSETTRSLLRSRPIPGGLNTGEGLHFKEAE
jgi:hypothetical protein